MKKTLLMIVICATCTITIQAQKIYSTKSGTATLLGLHGPGGAADPNNQVAATFGTDGQIAMTCPVKDFIFPTGTSMEILQTKFRFFMEADRFPSINVSGNFTDIKAVNFTKDGIYQVNFKGTVFLHGMTKTVTLPGTVEIKNSVPTVGIVYSSFFTDFGCRGLPSPDANRFTLHFFIKY